MNTVIQNNRKETRRLLEQMATARAGKSSRDRIIHGISGLIEEKRLLPDSPLPSSNELVEIFGVSVSTLQSAMNDLSRRGLVYRKPRVGTFVSRPDLKANGINVLNRLVVFSDMNIETLSDQFLKSYFGAILEAAHRRNYEVVLESSGVLGGGLIAEKKERWKEMAALVMVSPSASLLEQAEQFAEEGYRVLLLNAHSENVKIGSVFSDNFSGSYQATKSLVELGHKRICFLVPGDIKNHISYIDRYESCRQAMAEAGLGEPYVLNELSIKTLRRGLLDMDGGRATAVLDIGCGQIFDMLKLMNIRVPEDVSVISYDQGHKTTEDGKTIATVEQPIVEIVERAFSLIPNLESGGFSLRLPQLFYKGGTINSVSEKR